MQRLNGLFLSLHHETVGMTVSIQVFQNITETIRTFLVDGHHSPFVVRLQHTPGIPRENLRTHEPTVTGSILLVIRPGIDHPVLVRQEAVHRTSEHLHRIHEQRYRTYPIVVRGTVHVIISLDTCRYLSPSRHRPLLAIQGHYLLLRRAIHHPFTRLRIQHYMASPRRCRILQQIGIKQQRVDVFLRIRLADFHVQVRPERVTLISSQSKHLTLFQRKAVGLKFQVHRKRLVLVLVSLHHLLHFGHEAMQMPMHRGITIVVCDVDRLTIPTGSHRYPTDISIGYAADRLSYHALRLEVHPTMKMVGTQLPEIPAQQQGEIKRRNKRIIRFFLCRKSHGNTHQSRHRPTSYLILQIPFFIHSTNIQINSQNPWIFPNFCYL